jgi:RHS repeat-associated protein
VNNDYDGLGNRVAKTVITSTNTITTYFVVDEQNPSGYAQVLEEHVSTNSQPPTLNKVYAFGHTLISQDRLDGNVWRENFYGYDGHDNVRYLTDINGIVTDTYDYDAFGNLIARTGNTPNNYLFTGEQFDSDLNLYYLRSRYHNPDTGRFWTMDSFEGDSREPLSLHKYLYCGSNPVNCSDPTGKFSLAEQVKVGALIGSMAIVSAPTVAVMYTSLARGGLPDEYLFGYYATWHGLEVGHGLDAGISPIGGYYLICAPREKEIAQAVWFGGELSLSTGGAHGSGFDLVEQGVFGMWYWNDKSKKHEEGIEAWPHKSTIFYGIDLHGALVGFELSPEGDSAALLFGGSDSDTYGVFGIGCEIEWTFDVHGASQGELMITTAVLHNVACAAFAANAMPSSFGGKPPSPVGMLGGALINTAWAGLWVNSLYGVPKEQAP